MAALAAAVLWARYEMEKAIPDPIDIRKEPDYTFKVEEDPTGLDNCADVCLHRNGVFHSLTLVWKQRTGCWKYGGDKPWGGYAGTREEAINISKVYLLREARKEDELK